MNTKAPQPVARRLGGWKHPLSLVLLLAATAWFVGTIGATTDWDVPVVGKVPFLFDLGKWNYVIAGALAFAAMSWADRTRPPLAPGQSLGWRHAGPAMVISGIVGLLWIVTFYVIAGTDVDIPVYSDLGNWNIVIGMGFIVAAFGFATKWE